MTQEQEAVVRRCAVPPQRLQDRQGCLYSFGSFIIFLFSVCIMYDLLLPFRRSEAAFPKPCHHVVLTVSHANVILSGIRVGYAVIDSFGHNIPMLSVNYTSSFLFDS